MTAPAQRIAVARREMPAGRHIPYVAHVSDTVVRTGGGEYVQVYRLSGASFESEDDDTLNSWHERLNVTWRNIASPNLALWVHVIRRRESAAAGRAPGSGFAGRLAERYQRRLAGETLMVNELYLSTVYRPVVGRAPSIRARLLQRQDPLMHQILLGSSAGVRGMCHGFAHVRHRWRADPQPDARSASPCAPFPNPRSPVRRRAASRSARATRPRCASTRET